MAGPKTTSTDSKQSATKGMHRRSRTGCFTCRLRRKKCDEGRPACKACRHLGLQCAYKRPMWWSNNDHRSKEKDKIKNIIKHTKLNEKAASQQGTMTATNTPPSLSHSIRTSRGTSLESQLSNDFNFNTYTTQDLFTTSIMGPPQFAPSSIQYAPPEFSPYELDITTQCQTFVNDVETRRDSTVSSFSAYHVPVLPGQDFPDDAAWVQSEFHESRRESFVEEPFVDAQFWELAHAPFSPQHSAVIQVEEKYQYLLQHFMDSVMPRIFPVLEASQPGFASRDVILPALETNSTYLHSSLSAAALHLKTHNAYLDKTQINNDIMDHRLAVVTGIIDALNDVNANHEQTLETALAMIYFQCSIGREDDDLKDVPWNSHFETARQLIERLGLTERMRSAFSYGQQPPFSMTLASWIDILGSTMLCRVPIYADLYREKNQAGTSAGLAELMGCDDKIMFIISEIAALDAKAHEGWMDDLQLCHYIKVLGDELSMTEQGTPPVSPITENGAINPKQLTHNITHVFRLAARLYLCSLVPDFDPQLPHIAALVAQISDLMALIPMGEHGYDRSLVWPLLIAGSISIADSPFRTMFASRSFNMGDAAHSGSFGRLTELLHTVWQYNDEAFARGEKRGLHWREAMRQQAWDFLLI